MMMAAVITFGINDMKSVVIWVLESGDTGPRAVKRPMITKSRGLTKQEVRTHPEVAWVWLEHLAHG
jgi:hypothetical protein